MKSATSYFNGTLLKKNLTRYWPIWALYTVIWTYALPISCLMAQQQTWRADSILQRVTDFAQDIPYMLDSFGTIMAFCFGILTAMAMFSYLYHSRAAGMIHSLPMRREGLFLTSYVSGLICLLAPHGVVWLATLAAEAPSGYVDLYTITIWLLAQSAMCLFFYSFAVFCAMFTGHLLALPVFYGILNFLAMVITLLLDTLLEPFLYGYAGLPAGAQDVILWLTPVFRLSESIRWKSSALGGTLSGVGTLAAYAAAGVLLSVFALLVYRKRHIETAGDVVAVSVVRPIFKYGVALCSGLCFGYWLYAMFGFSAPFGLTGSLLLWAFVGYFAAEMLLKKSFRVLHAWRGCVVLLVLVATGLAALRLDAFGFTSRIPDPAAVISMTVDGMGSYPYDEGRNFEFKTEDPALIQKATALHRAIVSEHKEPWSGDRSQQEYVRLNVTYTLPGGTTLRRQYGAHVAIGSPLAQAARDFYCDPEVAKLSYALDEIDPTKLVNVEVSSLWNADHTEGQYYDLSQSIPAEERQTALLAIYDAVMADFAGGHLGRRYLFDLEDARQLNTYTADLTIFWQSQPEEGEFYSVSSIQTEGAGSVLYSRTHALSVTLTPQAEHTIRTLAGLGVLDADTTLRIYRDIVDERDQVKLIHDDLTFFPEDTAVIGGYDGNSSVRVPVD